jgi:hypothetical protein
MSEKKFDIGPSKEELNIWLLSTLKHVCHIEYFIGKLNIKSNDPERPHDIVGKGNKFSWETMKGLSLIYRNGDSLKPLIDKSIELHRQQYHHQKWNEPNGTSTKEDMEFGAVDSICCLLEGREYQGGKHSYNEITKLIQTKCEKHKKSWIEKMIPEMQNLKQPDLESIVSIKRFPNIGIKDEIYTQIQNRIYETIIMLKERGYNL